MQCVEAETLFTQCHTAFIHTTCLAVSPSLPASSGARTPHPPLPSSVAPAAVAAASSGPGAKGGAAGSSGPPRSAMPSLPAVVRDSATARRDAAGVRSDSTRSDERSDFAAWPVEKLRAFLRTHGEETSPSQSKASLATLALKSALRNSTSFESLFHPAFVEDDLATFMRLPPQRAPTSRVPKAGSSDQRSVDVARGCVTDAAVGLLCGFTGDIATTLPTQPLGATLAAMDECSAATRLWPSVGQGLSAPSVVARHTRGIAARRAASAAPSVAARHTRGIARGESSRRISRRSSSCSRVPLASTASVMSVELLRCVALSAAAPSVVACNFAPPSAPSTAPLLESTHNAEVVLSRLLGAFARLRVRKSSDRSHPLDYFVLAFHACSIAIAGLAGAATKQGVLSCVRCMPSALSAASRNRARGIVCAALLCLDLACVPCRSDEQVCPGTSSRHSHEHASCFQSGSSYDPSFRRD